MSIRAAAAAEQSADRSPQARRAWIACFRRQDQRCGPCRSTTPGQRCSSDRQYFVAQVVAVESHHPLFAWILNPAPGPCDAAYCFKLCGRDTSISGRTSQPAANGVSVPMPARPAGFRCHASGSAARSRPGHYDDGHSGTSPCSPICSSRAPRSVPRARRLRVLRHGPRRP